MRQTWQWKIKLADVIKSTFRFLSGWPATAAHLVTCLFILSFGLIGTAKAQSNSACSESELRSLKNAIEIHNEHAYRLSKKFKDVWYPQGPIPAEVRKLIRLENIKSYLAVLGQRKAAVLLHGVENGDVLRAWLITYRGDVICAAPKILSEEDWGTLQPANWNTLGARGVRSPRTATPLEADHGTQRQPQNWDVVLKRLSDVLLPRDLKLALEAEKIDTLVVVPITVREFNPTVDREETSTTNVEKKRSALSVPSSRAALSIGVVPFSALPIGDGVLLDKMSVIISPGFFTFTQSPQEVRKKYSNAIVVGNPERKGFLALPGAEGEAKGVAELLHTNRVFLKKDASKVALQSYLQESSSAVDYIHLATHGIADAENPVDESYLIFSDGPWNAREISRLRRPVLSRAKGKHDEEDLPLLDAKPLVVMSACQTALGKDFPAGTIGLARAWHWAGASNVVMSLWSVDDHATQELMESFVGLVVEGQAVDKALQSAMASLRGKYPNPSYWAGFSVYGAPEYRK